jgi:hypothetical protein
MQGNLTDGWGVAFQLESGARDRKQANNEDKCTTRLVASAGIGTLDRDGAGRNLGGQAHPDRGILSQRHVTVTLPGLHKARHTTVQELRLYFLPILVPCLAARF